jgi:EAL domain-containing protein (putative c-di-GMP-specific phosphodiesterase class I)
MGVDYVQGYLIHRPEPIDDLLEDLGSPSDLLCVQGS